MNIKDDFKIAIRTMRVPSNTMEQLRSKTLLDALEFLLIVGAVTALLTPLQIVSWIRGCERTSRRRTSRIPS